MVITNDYEIVFDYEKNVYLCVSHTTPKCPICKEKLKYRDRKKRIQKTYEGQYRFIKIRRMKCERCGLLHSELPDCIIPYKHYETTVIVDVLKKKAYIEDYPCECTMIRWFSVKNVISEQICRTNCRKI